MLNEVWRREFIEGAGCKWYKDDWSEIRAKLISTMNSWLRSVSNVRSIAWWRANKQLWMKLWERFPIWWYDMNPTGTVYCWICSNYRLRLDVRNWVWRMYMSSWLGKIWFWFPATALELLGKALAGIKNYRSWLDPTISCQPLVQRDSWEPFCFWNKN